MKSLLAVVLLALATPVLAGADIGPVERQLIDNKIQYAIGPEGLRVLKTRRTETRVEQLLAQGVITEAQVVEYKFDKPRRK